MKRRLVAAAFALSLATPAAALDLSAMNDQERDAFGDAVRAYLLDNPEVIMEAVQALEAKQAANQTDTDLALVAANRDALFNDGYSWVGGNPDGDVTLVEFMDYRCGYCRKAHDEVALLLKEDGNIRWIVKELPILGEASVLSSRFAVAVKQVVGDDAYRAAHDALITFGGEVNERSLRRLANNLGLDADAVLAQMDSDEVTKEIAETRALSQRLQVNGTPTFVMGDQMIRGYVPPEGMQHLLEQVRG